MEIPDKTMYPAGPQPHADAGEIQLRSGRKAFFRKWVIRPFWIMLVTALLLGGVACLPGKVEGIYRGGQCMCGGRIYLRMEEGNMVMYFEDHPPGQWVGRYEIAPDGSVSTFMFSAKEGEIEKKEPGLQVGHLFFMRSINPQGETEGWDFKWPFLGHPKVVEEQEIEMQFMREDRSMVSKIYSPQFEFLREEIKPPRKRN